MRTGTALGGRELAWAEAPGPLVWRAPAPHRGWMVGGYPYALPSNQDPGPLGLLDPPS